MNNKTGNYLLYLDTRDLPPERDGQILAAVESGFGLVIATDRPDKYRYHQVDYIIDTPVGKYDIAQQDIDAFIGLHGIRLAGILCWKDREVELASRLALHFHLPGNSPEAARRVRDKAETRKALAHLDANPKYSVIGSRSEFAMALPTIGFPSLLKPAGNSGSRGIIRVSDPGNRDLYDEFFQYNNRGAGDMFSYYTDHALLEEELTGSEHSVAGLVYQGRVYVMAIADKRFEREIFMQYENIIPSQLASDTQTAVVDLVTEAVTSVGLSYGGFHADVIVANDGKPYILEIGGRLGGELINSHLIPLAYGGYSPYEQVIKVVTGGAPVVSKEMYRHPTMRAGARIVRAPHVGTIKRIEGLEKLSWHPAARLVMQMKGPHSTVHKPQDKFKHYEIAYIIAQCGLGEDICELLSSLESLVKIEMYAETPATPMAIRRD